MSDFLMGSLIALFFSLWYCVREGGIVIKYWKFCALCALLLCLTACGQGTGKKKEDGASGGLFATVVTYSGEDDDAKYLEIAGRSQRLVGLLEEKAGAFVMDAYNFQEIEEGTPL